jgi:anti-sigma factor RsiW
MTHEQAVEKQATERYLLEEMPELERFAFEEHLFDCPICADDVRAGAIMQGGVKAGLLPVVGSGEAADRSAEGNREQLSPVPHKPGTPVSQALETARPRDLATASARRHVGGWRGATPWAAAAAFALAAGYQALFVVPGLRDQVIGPSVLSPVTLRGATRGTEPTLTRPAAGVIAVAVDLAGVAAGAGLTYDLRAAEGVSVASGTAVAPPPGTPLLLLIPASTLDSAGRYTLAGGTSGAPGSTSLEFHFTIAERDQ